MSASNTEKKTSNQGNLPTVFGRIKEPIKIYPVTEDELTILEKVEHSSLYRQLTFVFLSSAISVTAATLIFYYSKHPPDLPVAVIALLSALYMGGGLMYFVWQRNKADSQAVLGKIRERIEKEKEGVK